MLKSKQSAVLYEQRSTCVCVCVTGGRLAACQSRNQRRHVLPPPRLDLKEWLVGHRAQGRLSLAEPRFADGPAAWNVM